MAVSLNPLRLAILGSTRGTDAQAVIDAIEKKELNAVIVFVLSDRDQAYILERARNHGLHAIYLSPKEKTR